MAGGERRRVSFHDYKKDGAPEAVLKKAFKAHGWESVINRQGTTWRQLPDNVKNGMDEKKAADIAAQNPSVIKRPLLSHDGRIHLGFKEELYREIFS
jgi:arsenate reductase